MSSTNLLSYCQYQQSINIPTQGHTIQTLCRYICCFCLFFCLFVCLFVFVRSATKEANLHLHACTRKVSIQHSAIYRRILLAAQCALTKYIKLQEQHIMLSLCSVVYATVLLNWWAHFRQHGYIDMVTTIVHLRLIHLRLIHLHRDSCRIHIPLHQIHPHLIHFLVDLWLRLCPIEGCMITAWEKMLLLTMVDLKPRVSIVREKMLSLFIVLLVRF